MIPIPGIYHPPVGSDVHDLYGGEIAGEITMIDDSRIHIRIPLDNHTGRDPHTTLMICEHSRVTISGQ